MKNNIFEGAKFGDKFLTDKDVIAIYVNRGTKHHILLLDKDNGFIYCNDNGDDLTNQFTLYNIISRYQYNIISRYQEPIDENKLNDLAIDSDYHMSRFERTNDWTRDDYYREGFKAGYRSAFNNKAKEE